MRPENLGDATLATINRSARWALSLEKKELAVRMGVARTVSAEKRKERGTLAEAMRRRGVQQVALIRERLAARRRKEQAHLEQRARLEQARVRTVRPLLDMGTAELRDQVLAFKLLDGKKAVLRPHKRVLLDTLVCWIVEKHGAAANDCTAEEIDAAGGRRAARAPRAADAQPARKKGKPSSEELWEVDAILDARFCPKQKCRVYLVQWAPHPTTGASYRDSWEGFASFCGAGGAAPNDEIVEMIAEVDADTEALKAEREPIDERVNELCSRELSVGARVLVEPDENGAWRVAEVVERADDNKFSIKFVGGRSSAAVQVPRESIMAAPPAATRIKADDRVRVCYDERWFFGKVTSVVQGRELVKVAFEDGSTDTVPIFDAFYCADGACVAF